MRLSGIGTNNSLFNVGVINKQLSRANENNNAQNNLSIQQRNRDSVFISGQGKQKNIIQQLMNQKQMVQECKDAEMTRGLEDGYVNQDKLDEYDEQLEMIDKQIAEATVEQPAEDNKEKNTNFTDNNNAITEEEYEQRKLMNIMNVSSQIDQIEVVSEVKGKLDGEAKVLKAEIKSDINNGIKLSESKKDRVNEIETKTSDLSKQIGDKVANINDNITEVEDSVRVDDDIYEKNDDFNADEIKNKIPYSEQTKLETLESPTNKLDMYI